MIFDLHNDFPTVLPLRAFGRYLSEHNDCIVTAAIWTSEMPPDNTVSEVKRLTDVLSGLVNPPPIAIEDIGFLGGEYKDFDFSRYFYCTLTWNYDNRFAGGALDNGTLTADGRRVIAVMNGQCATDLAHLNRKSFFEVLDEAVRPMCSHTGFMRHPRCLDDEQVRSLIEKRGIIGISAVTDFTGAHTVGELAGEIDRFIQRFGGDTLCLGTDFFGTEKLPSGFVDYGGCAALEDALFRLGYTSDDTRKILYGNAKRFYEEIIHERHL